MTAVPIILNLEKCHVSQFDRDKVTELFRQLEFNSLIAKLPGEKMAPAEGRIEVEVAPVQGKYEVVNTETALGELVSRLSSVPSFAIDTETDGLNAMEAKLVGISVSPAPGEAYYLPVGHIGLDTIKQLPLEVVVSGFKPILEEGNISKIAHNSKFDMTVLAGCGLTVNNLDFDTMLAAYLLGEKAIGLKTLAFARLGVEITA